MMGRFLALLFLPLLSQCVRPQAYPPEVTSGVPPEPRESPLPALRPPTATWQRTSALRSQTLAGGAVLHEFTAHSTTESAEMRCVLFDSDAYSLRVLDQPSSSAGSSVISRLMRQVGAVAGVNGGFFHPDFSPLGQMITEGQKQGQFTRSSLISGSVVVIGQEPYLVWNQEFLGDQGVTQMLQAGPRLVDAGQPLASLNRTQIATRTFIATDGQRQWLLGTARGTSLAGLGELLASAGVVPGIEVQRALNLDGGRSTAFYALTHDQREIRDAGWSTVRNYLAIVPR